jgi:hypothetical protein
MKGKLSGLKPPEIKAKCIETLGQAGAVVDANARGFQGLAAPDQPARCRSRKRG